MHQCAAGQLAIVPLAALGALGWWVLRVNEKDAAGAVKWTGRVVGGFLVFVGVSGALCAGVSHMKSKMSGLSSCGSHGGAMMKGCDHEMGGGMGAMTLPPGHPPIGSEDAPAAVPAPKKK